MSFLATLSARNLRAPAGTVMQKCARVGYIDVMGRGQLLLVYMALPRR